MSGPVYYLYRLSGALVPHVPPAIGYALCRGAGMLFYQFNKPARAVVEQNLRQILGQAVPPAEIKRLARQTFNHILYNHFDLFRLPRMNDDAVQQVVTVEGWHHVTDALSASKGIVMTSAHLGNIEVVLYAMLLRGLKITIPVERIEPPALFDYVTNLRMSKGLTLIPIDGPLIHLLRTLKKGGVAGLAGDRDITNTGQIVPFFGRNARLPDGHVRLALKTGAPLVLGFSRRLNDHSYRAYFLPAYYPPEHGSEEERVAEAMNHVVKQIEKAIRQTPEQWTVTVPVWVDA